MPKNTSKMGQNKFGTCDVLVVPMCSSYSYYPIISLRTEHKVSRFREIIPLK
jgi:hypothetical protein